MTRARLADVSTFDALLSYLREELDWPIDEFDASELTFNYDPAADLGLPLEAAARVVTLRQLRPIRAGQRWAVFYVAFEQAYLPLRVVQRVLRGICARGRAAAADRPLFEPCDVLLIAASGQAGSRRFDFAHAFAAEAAQRDVCLLGWQHDEPEPRLDWIEAQVRAGLRWPGSEDPAARDDWPARWRETFLQRRARPRAVWSELTPSQQSMLVALYAAGDHTVDVLPYTADFAWLLDCFNRAAGTNLTAHEFWRALSTARKGGHLPKKQRGLADPPAGRYRRTASNEDGRRKLRAVA